MTTSSDTRAERRRAAVVARAAASGASTGSRSGGEQASRRKFLSVVAAVVIVGTMLVGWSWAERQYEHPTTLDSWQNAYAVFDCQDGSWIAPFDSRSNPDGIRSRGDGVIYIEPATDAVAGDNATLEVFLDAMGARLTDDTFTLPDGTVLDEQGTFCDSEEAVLQVRRWEAGAAEPTEVRFSDLADTRFLADGQSIVIAFAPMNASIPAPPSASDLISMSSAAAAAAVDE